MRIQGKIKNQEAVSLIDSRCTHTFLDATVLPSLQLQLDNSRILEVKVADGTITKTLRSCHEVTIIMQGYRFVMDFNVLHLGGCEVFLGTQWLSTLGEISWDFQILTLKFLHLGKRVFLQGLQPTTSTILEVDRFFSGLERKGQVFHISPADSATPVQPHLLVVLADLLVEFSKVVAVPIGLPPIRDYEHSITLKEGSQPVCERPYRYPYFQKSEIEKIVNELLEVDYIQPSRSPFSSPMLFVRKADDC